MIALDGTPPIAKLEQQRQRRYKTWYIGNITNAIKKKITPDPFNTVEITCGTNFMKMLNERLSSHFNAPEKYSVEKLVVSSSDEAAEGEHKIFDYIRDNKLDVCDDTHLIYGLDSDLIMLCINHLPICPNMYLFRETPEFIKSINRSLIPNENYIMDIPLLAEMITLDMDTASSSDSGIKMNRVYDYIFLCFFLGNDFLPHFPSMNIRTGGIDKLLNAYKATIGGTKEVLTDGNTIFWRNVRKLLTFLKEREHEYITKELSDRAKKENTYFPDDDPDQMYVKLQAIPVTERELEKYIEPESEYWEVRYYRSLFCFDASEEKKKEISINFLEGLEWTMKYYTKGCVDWRWYYRFKYPPLLCHLLPHIPEFDTTFVPEKSKNPVSQLVQMAYVLPQDSLNLLPTKLYKSLLLNYITKWYGTDYDFVWCFCKYFWESHVMLPEINIAELEAFVEKVMDPKNTGIIINGGSSKPPPLPPTESITAPVPVPVPVPQPAPVEKKPRKPRASPKQK